MTLPNIISFPYTGAEDIGKLVVAEGDSLPFPIKRVYWTFDVPTAKIRGHHAHHDLQQLIVAIHGSIEIVVETPNRHRHSFLLSQPNEALYVPQMCWREIKFHPSAVLLCLASMEYDEADYIRSYYDFVQLVENKNLAE